MKHFNFWDEGNKKKETLRNEKKLAKSVGGTPQPISGAITGFKGDVKTKDYLFDLKQTTKKSSSVTIKDLHKIQREADSYMKEPVLLLQFDSIKIGDKQWAVIPMRVFKELTNADT